MPGVGLREHHALIRYGIYVGRRHRSTGNTAAECRQVVDAEVIRQNKDNIRRALARRQIGLRRALLPLLMPSYRKRLQSMARTYSPSP